MSSPTCSIVIPVFNRAELTRECLAALRDTTDRDRYELIVVDNASSDDTAALLERHPLSPGRSKRSESGIRARVQSGRRCGARGVRVVPEQRHRSPAGLAGAVARDRWPEPAVAAVGNRLLYPDSRLIQHAGVAFDLPGPIPYHLWRSFPADWPPANQQRDLDAVTAACVLVRRSVFLDLGGFDERYRNGFEDIDFCLRLREKGHRIVYCPESVVWHHKSMSEGRNAHDEPNAELFLQRWADRLRDQITPRRELIVAALDETFRINRSGGKFVGIAGLRLIRRDVFPPRVRVFRHRIARDLTALWLRFRFFPWWLSARRIKADLLRAGR